MKFLRYIYRGLFGPKCPRCDMRDFEWKDNEHYLKTSDRIWNLHCNACGSNCWKFQGTDDRLFEVAIKKELSYKTRDALTKYERDRMTNTFDGRVICPDCEHYPLCGSPRVDGTRDISCTKCGSQFNYIYRNPLDIIRLTDRMPYETAQVLIPVPEEPDHGFILGGSL